MKININGLYHEQIDEDGLQDLKETLLEYTLPVLELTSQENGTISAEVPDAVDMREITAPLATFAEVLARHFARDVWFELEVPKWGIRCDIAGAA